MMVALGPVLIALGGLCQASAGASILRRERRQRDEADAQGEVLRAVYGTQAELPEDMRDLLGRIK